ncbi:MAG: Leucine efflux protein [Flavobacterium sp. SCGC AAA160-P02]|nr:MAG: Leucine efflux protein [Flavobacterium sp. SCGC AAA160-P02]
MDTNILLSFIASVTLLAISPGPDNIFVLMQSVIYGKKYGLATVIGLMTGCIIHTSLVAFGISSIIKTNNTLFYGIKIVGAFYLLYLAYKVFKSSSDIKLNMEEIQKKSPFQLVKIGFLMNVLNPKVTIFFLALFPSFLFSDSLSIVIQFYVLGGLFILTSFVVFSFIAILGGNISEKIQKNKKIGFWLQWMQVIVFVGIALFILT